MLHSMEDDLLVHAPAKLNLALSVGAPRPDGLHPLSSWMVTLGWGDSIYLRRRDPGSSSLFANVWAADAPHTPDLDWPLRSDLSWKAHAAIERAVGRQLPVRVRVEKRIPVGGGLGGGSSNAAAVLRGLDELFDLRLGSDQLRSIAAGLGSDVAFLVEGGSAIVSGVGERVDALPDVPQVHVVLCFPEAHCPTPTVYRLFDALRPDAGDPEHARVLGLAARDRLRAHEPFNDLAAPARESSEAVRRAMDEIAEVTQLPVHVCGSGSSLFLVCDDPIHAEHVAHAVANEAAVKAVATQVGGPGGSVRNPPPARRTCA
jgi:4-diphosphocytidyl-2-C-methyl-D-erythritol kinase